MAGSARHMSVAINTQDTVDQAIAWAWLVKGY